MRQESREEGTGEVSRLPAETLRAEEMLGKNCIPTAWRLGDMSF